MFQKTRLLLIPAAFAVVTHLNACSPVSVAAGAGAEAMIAAAQERRLLDAVDDSTIQLKINARLLKADPKLFADVDTEVVEGRVLLNGTVPKPEDKVEAARLTWQVPGVREVLNELTVTDRTSIVDYFKDSWITTRLRAKMTTDPKVYDINYTVDTVNGVIYLMGIAQDQAELDRVTGHARTISGVRRVVSHVYLKDDPRRPKA